MRIRSVCLLLAGLLCAAVDCQNTNEDEAKQYLDKANKDLADQMRIFSEAQWAYNTNINDQTSEAQVTSDG